MDARAKTIREILHSGDQYLIPFFQRQYSWTAKHWKRLFSDLTQLLEDDDSKTQHFLGPLVCTPTDHVPGEVPAYQLIDGQQRLTTLTLLLCALRDVARENNLSDLSEEIGEDYLIHKRKKGLQKYKVVPRTGDREVLISAIENKVLDQHEDTNIFRALRFFRKAVSEFPASDPKLFLRSLYVAITERLSLVVITIDGENPYEIFESLNSTGLPLEESDLIRNYLFMQVPTSNQQEFNDEHWVGFEDLFEEKDNFASIKPTLFYRNYLMRLGTYSKPKFTFVDFKEQNRQRAISPKEQVNELKRFGQLEVALRRPSTYQNPNVGNSLRQIAMLDIATSHPLLLDLMDRFESSQLSEAELLDCLSDLASFVLRRSICGESTRNYGRWFCEATASINADPRDDLRRYWIKRGWPDDKSFTNRMVDFPIYRRESKKCRLILEELENSYGHKEKVDANTLTIEHVMPQTISSGKSANAWKEMLGKNWKATQDRWLHSLGNLTLSGYNSNLGNKQFNDKQIELDKSNLVLNDYFKKTGEWNEEWIERRVAKLTKEIVKIWPRPEGGEYQPTMDATKIKITADERRQRRFDYWTELLKLAQQEETFASLPKPSKSGFLSLPIGVRGFKLFAFINVKKHRIGVFLSCRGKKAKENFRFLLDQKNQLEQAIGEALIWEDDQKRKTCRIKVRRSNTDVLDRSGWREQHRWLMDEIAKFAAVFKPKCIEMIGDSNDSKSRLEVRKEFWTGLLKRSSEKTKLHSNISPSQYHWISTGAGVSGMGYTYAITESTSKIELYIDFGKGKKQKNKDVFDTLREKKNYIEKEFSCPLEWRRSDDKRSSKITCHFDGGYRNSEDEWPVIQEKLIDGMIRFEKTLSPFIKVVGQS